MSPLVGDDIGAPPAISMPVSSGSWFAHHANRKIGSLSEKVPGEAPRGVMPVPGLSTSVSCKVLAMMMRPSLVSQTTRLPSS